MAINVIPAEAELRKIRARVTEVAWMIRALDTSRTGTNFKALLNLIERWPDHQVQSLAAMLIFGQQFESREAASAAIRNMIERRAQLFAELLSQVGRIP